MMAEQATQAEQSEQEQETTTEEQGQEQEKGHPSSTPQDARDQAIAALNPEQSRDWLERSAHAARSGMPIPEPPGYNPPPQHPPTDAELANQANFQSWQKDQLQEAITEAEKANDWNRAGTLKGQLLNMSRQQNNRQAATYGWQGPKA